MLSFDSSNRAGRYWGCRAAASQRHRGLPGRPASNCGGVGRQLSTTARLCFKSWRPAGWQLLPDQLLPQCATTRARFWEARDSFSPQYYSPPVLRLASSTQGVRIATVALHLSCAYIIRGSLMLLPLVHIRSDRHWSPSRASNVFPWPSNIVAPWHHQQGPRLPEAAQDREQWKPRVGSSAKPATQRRGCAWDPDSQCKSSGVRDCQGLASHLHGMIKAKPEAERGSARLMVMRSVSP